MVIRPAVTLRDLLPPPTVDRRVEYELRKTQDKLKLINKHMAAGPEVVQMELEHYDRDLRRRQIMGERIKRRVRTPHPRVVAGMAMLQKHLNA